jgi:hypothetical protein
LAFDGIIVGDIANEREGSLMKRLILCMLIVVGTVTVLSAQSGRKIRNPIPGTASAGVTPTQTATEEADAAKTAEVGFSESATNQPVSIFVDRERRRSNKSSKKTESETKSKAPEAQTKPADVDSEDEVIKVETNLISLPVTVSTRSGSYVPSLSKGNFKIFEDGIEQEVAYFGNVDKPFTAILLIDVSGSTSLKIEQIQDGAIAFRQSASAARPSHGCFVRFGCFNPDRILQRSSDRSLRRSENFVSAAERRFSMRLILRSTERSRRSREKGDSFVYGRCRYNIKAKL